MKNVYYFGDGKAEGAADQKNTLGGKGANLAEMTNLRIPVPPGFTLTTNLCMAYLEHGVYPESLENEVQSAVEKIELIMGCLLYTSPSPRDGLLSRMPSSA